MTAAKVVALHAEAQHVVDLELDLRDVATLVELAKRDGLRPAELFAQFVTNRAMAERHRGTRSVFDLDHARAVLARHVAGRAADRGCSCTFDAGSGQLITAPACVLHGKR